MDFEVRGDELTRIVVDPERLSDPVSHACGHARAFGDLLTRYGVDWAPYGPAATRFGRRFRADRQSLSAARSWRQFLA